MQTIDIFPWNDHFETGIELIDTQHRQLVKILNRLATQVAYQTDSEELNAIFDELVEYTSYHFESEEKIWDKHLQGDHLDIEHKKVHQKFIDTVLSLKNKQSAKPLKELADEALEVLAKWLVSHILESDQYMAYIHLGLENNLDLETATKEAEEKMSGASRVLVDIILSIYSTLSVNTMKLVRELKTHQTHDDTISYQDKYRQLLLELASSFINLPLHQIESQVQSSLRDMATFVDADRAYIFDYDFEEQTTSNTYEWCSEGIEPQIDSLQDVPLEALIDWPKIHAKGEHILIQNVNELPSEGLKEILAPQGIKSLVTFPLFSNGACTGFVGFDAVKQLYTFSGMEVELLSFFSKLLGNVSHRKEIETSLVEEKAFLKTLLREIPDLIWLKDKDGVYLACNERFEDFFGAKEKDIVGKTDYDFVEKSLADFFRKHDQKVIDTNETNINEEIVSFASDGHEELLQTTKLPIYDTQKNLIGVLGVARDITTLRDMQSKLEHKEHYQRALLDNFPFLIWLKDEESRFLAVNQAFADACNINSPDDLVGKTDFDIWPIELAQVYREDDQEVIVSGEPKTIEEEITTANESSIWAETYKSPVIIDNSTIGTVGFSRDITGRVESQKQLRLAASVFTHSREGIIITSAENKIIDMNNAVSTMTGYTKEELIGKNPSILSSGKHSIAFYQNMWNELRKNGFWSGEVSNKKKNGEVFVEILTITAVKDEKDNLVHYVALLTDITQIKEQQTHLEYVAHYDALTGLPNRVLLSDRLQQAIALTHRNKSSIAVVYLDLDGFKNVNDSHGHDIGDKLLTIVSDRMRKTLREGDTIARIGGDEFVAVLHNLQTHEECIPMLDRLLYAASKIVKIDKLQAQVTASLGVSFFDPDDSMDADQLLRFADQAMYQAKLTGKNRFHIFDVQSDTDQRIHHENISIINDAIDKNEFTLYYQPKVNMAKGIVVGLEALIRWNHPTKGLLSPAEFLPLIEGDTLVTKLGEWVLKEAFEQISSWKKNGLNITVSINIDAPHLLNGNIVIYLRKLLAAYPEVSPKNIALEILETSALEDIMKVSEVMRECQEIGIKFSLDDFGTGYSSLTYLKRLPASELKIDQSFVRDMLHDPDDLAILEGVISLAAAFRRNIIAEGVESIKHGRVLLQLGCEIAQGYVIARPMPAQDVIGWIETWKPDTQWSNVVTITRDEIPILYATVEHTAWVSHIREYLTNNSFSLPEQDHTQCRFGKWLHKEGVENYSNRPGFENLKNMHYEIHAYANELIHTKKSGISVSEENIQTLQDLSLQLIGILEAFQSAKI